MFGVYPIEIKKISLFLATYDKFTPWQIHLHGGIDGHISCYGLLFLLIRKKNDFC
jgi:hypothetical protein